MSSIHLQAVGTVALWLFENFSPFGSITSLSKEELCGLVVMSLTVLFLCVQFVQAIFILAFIPNSPRNEEAEVNLLTAATKDVLKNSKKPAAAAVPLAANDSGASNKKMIIGVGVAIVKDDCVLIGKRKNAHGAGTWAFAGGKVEFGESWIATARREVMEETNLDLGRDVREDVVLNCVMMNEGVHAVVPVVVATLEGPLKNQVPIVMEKNKCEGWVWVKWTDVLKGKMPKDDNGGKGDDTPASGGAPVLFGPLKMLVERKWTPFNTPVK